MATLKSTPDVPLPEAITRYLERAGLAPPRALVVPLTGDASDRRYFRVIRRDGASIVLALHAAPFSYDTLPFVNVAGLLAQVPVPIPAILGHADDLGILEQQDLGDVTLQAHLGAARPHQHAALYRQAIAFIAAIQRRGAELASDRYVPYGVAFDVEKLTWELDFFVKHFVVAYRGAEIAASDREALSGEFAQIAQELAGEPRVLCHRDYHSRNLMLREGRLFIIDFQDARMGPDTYDLASLLRDSYVDIDDAAVEDSLAYFLALRGGTAPEGSAAEFRRRFDLMALQRNLKALGTFGYQTATRRNPVYIQYMPRTLHYARATLSKHERFARLQELLGRYVGELRP
ncbi:MAG TPA: phosphotransferase [Vicinamibacterales bacterium]|nr:phosphotransferase [Vicinamibacterales bacterium]HPW20631.1 phosphotransferase [Vicinamibacterales bacterium]